MNDIQKLLLRLEMPLNREKQENLLLLILIELQYLMFRIQLCSTTLQANEFFDVLEDIQLVLAKLSNKGQIQLPLLLHQFIIAFGDVYDRNIRTQLFENINKNKYVYGDIANAFSRILDDIKQGILKPSLTEAQQQLISKNIQDILHSIAASKQCTDADVYFIKLLNIQELLSKATFVYNIVLDESFMQFIYDCERLDDSQTRMDLFKRIKHGEYNIFSDEVQ